MGTEQSLLHNTEHSSPNTTSPSCNVDGNNVSDDVALVDSSFKNGHDNLFQDTNNIYASYHDDDSKKDLLFLMAILQIMVHTILLFLPMVITVMLHNKT